MKVTAKISRDSLYSKNYKDYEKVKSKQGKIKKFRSDAVLLAEMAEKKQKYLKKIKGG